MKKKNTKQTTSVRKANEPIETATTSGENNRKNKLSPRNKLRPSSAAPWPRRGRRTSSLGCTSLFVFS